MTDIKASELYDVIIIGGGPAGLTAAIYLARARYRVLVMEKEQFGGQITITSEVVNYPGIPQTDGRTLTEAMRKQAAGFGAEFLKATAEEIRGEKIEENQAEREVLMAKEQPEKVREKNQIKPIVTEKTKEDTWKERSVSEKMTEDNWPKQRKAGERLAVAGSEKTEEQMSAIWLIRTDRGEFRCFGLLAATGAHPRMIGFEGEEKFRGHGVAYCATCDGEFFTGKKIFVVGGGFAAAEESVFLTKYASHVTILVREPDFTCAKATADAARSHEKITVLVNTEVEAVTGNVAVTGIRYINNVTGERSEYRASEGDSIGVFVFAGYEPATELFRGLLELDKQGYIMTDRNQRTSVEGIYAAGDVCVKNLRQVVTAVGDGATAATELEKYAAKMQKETGLVPTTKEMPNKGKNNRPDMRSANRNMYDAEKEEGKRWKAHGQGRNNGRHNEKAERTEAGNGREAENGSKYAKREETGRASGSDSLFDEDTLAQLADVFDRMEQELILEIHPDDRSISLELEEYMNILAAMTEKLTVRTVKDRDRNGEKQLSAMTFHSEEKQNSSHLNSEERRNGGHLNTEEKRNGGHLNPEEKQNGGYLNPEEKQNGGYLNPEEKQNGGYLNPEEKQNGVHLNPEKKRNGCDLNPEEQEKISGGVDDENLPYVRILRADDTDTGLAFHGVPGGHEFTPFILSLFNASGPGQKINGELEKRIAAIRRPVHMKIMVSLTCEVCPDLVAAAQRIAAGNPYITAEVYDFAHFPQMSEEYHVLSVPCLIVNGDYATFGKKTMKQLLDILETIA